MLFWPGVCASYQDSFPFWELLANLFVTGTVTAVTIVAATRSARKVTLATLRNSASLQRQALKAQLSEALRLERRSEGAALIKAIDLAVLARAMRDDEKRSYDEAIAEARHTVGLTRNNRGRELLEVVADQTHELVYKSNDTTRAPTDFIRVSAVRQGLRELVGKWVDEPRSVETEIQRRADELAAKRKQQVDDIIERLLTTSPTKPADHQTGPGSQGHR
ncbi:hypothetical protein [Leifsonia sp. 1010]|uniref:hypothetical protein n=1 Tax=Leifsonia sp. 1010 TaxID=2817769 RepID=UPI00286A5665|nr:hypothetical protein [Leifsonia sp. 1010]